MSYEDWDDYESEVQIEQGLARLAADIGIEDDITASVLNQMELSIGQLLERIARLLKERDHFRVQSHHWKQEYDKLFASAGGAKLSEWVEAKAQQLLRDAAAQIEAP